tara:strand:- start:532 stop:1371 length:840 start_codon:yes stop_codon:yes gene_type:complete
MSPIFVGGRIIFGALSSQPTGITTTAGSEYYNTTNNQKYIYSGASNSWERNNLSTIRTTDSDPFGDNSSIAAFPLNGNATSLSGTTFSGTLSGDNGGSNFSSGGKFDQYWIGSGSTQLNSTSTSIRPSGSFSLTFWYKSNTTGQDNKRLLTVQGTTLCAGWNNYNNSLGFYTGTGSSNVNTTPLVTRVAQIPDASINDNSWHHLGFTISATNTWSIYLDGSVYSGAVSGENRSFNNGTFFAVTTYDTGTGYNTICGIDQIRLFSRILTAGEIAKLYNES